jgi:hypothetical protein
MGFQYFVPGLDLEFQPRAYCVPLARQATRILLTKVEKAAPEQRGLLSPCGVC